MDKAEEKVPTLLTAERLEDIEQGAWLCGRYCYHVPELLDHIRAQDERIAATLAVLKREDGVPPLWQPATRILEGATDMSSNGVKDA